MRIPDPFTLGQTLADPLAHRRAMTGASPEAFKTKPSESCRAGIAGSFPPKLVQFQRTFAKSETLRRSRPSHCIRLIASALASCIASKVAVAPRTVQDHPELSIIFLHKEDPHLGLLQKVFQQIERVQPHEG